MVHLIVIYDAEAERTRHYRTYLRRHLTHLQQSVFEGGVTAGTADEIREMMDRLVSESAHDAVVVYEVSSQSYLKREAYGDDPVDDKHIL